MFLTTSWWRRMFAAVAMMILAFAVSPATPAHADLPYGEIQSYLRPIWCLSANTTPYPGFPANTGMVYTTPCSGDDHQGWNVGNMSSTTVGQIQQEASGDCVSTNYQQPPGGNSNTRAVYIVPCNNSPYQDWYFRYDGTIYNAYTGWCLSTNLTPYPGAPASSHAVYTTLSCTTIDAHRWDIVY